MFSLKCGICFWIKLNFQPMEEDFENALVFEISSRKVVAGIAGDYNPKFIYPSFIAKEKKGSNNKKQQDLSEYIGNDVKEKRYTCDISYTLNRSKVENFENYEKIVDQIFQDLKEAPEKRQCMVSHSIMETTKNLYKIQEIYFESFKVPAFCNVLDSILSLMAVSRNVGMILDVGDGHTTCYPVLDTFHFKRSCISMNFGGKDMTDYLMSSLRDGGHYFYNNNHREMIIDLKEKECGVLEKPEDYFNKCKSSKQEREEEKTYSLPDGTKINLGLERFKCGELLFNPNHYGFNNLSIQELLYESINAVDINSRKELYTNIILTGGVTYLKGFKDRLQKEMEKLLPTYSKLRISEYDERNNFVWMGGSTLSSLSSFSPSWITRNDYLESGADYCYLKNSPLN